MFEHRDTDNQSDGELLEILADFVAVVIVADCEYSDHRASDEALLGRSGVALRVRLANAHWQLQRLDLRRTLDRKDQNHDQKIAACKGLVEVDGEFVVDAHSCTHTDHYYDESNDGELQLGVAVVAEELYHRCCCSCEQSDSQQQ